MSSNIDDTQPLSGDTETLDTRNNFVAAKSEIEDLQDKDVSQDNAINGKEPTISPKNTGFNLNLGTNASQVAEGNHLHTGVYEPADSTIMKEGENVSLLSNDADYVPSDTTEANTSQILNIVGIGEADYNAGSQTTGTVYYITGA